MTRQEHLLVILGEECSEVQKEVSKILRFGFKDSHPDVENFVDNLTRLNNELNHINAMVEMLKDSGVGLFFITEIKEEKKARVEKYLEYSHSIGRLEIE